MKVIYELLLRTQQSIGVNDAKVKELNAQLVGERKTVAMHEKVSKEVIWPWWQSFLSTAPWDFSDVVETFSLVFRAFISQISVKFRCHKSFRMSQPSWSSFTQHWRIKLLWMPQNESAEEIWVLRLFILKLRSCYEWIHEMGRFIHWGNQVASKSCTFGNDLCGVIRFIHCDFLLRQYNQIVFGLRLRFTSYCVLTYILR